MSNTANIDQAAESALVTLKQASAHSARSIDTLYRDNKKGLIPFVKIGHSTRIRIRDLRKYIGEEVAA